MQNGRTEFMVALSLIDDAEDEWMDGGAVIAETVVDAEEHFWRELELRGQTRNYLRVLAYPLD